MNKELELLDEFLNIIEVPVKSYLLNINDKPALERYRVLRTEIENALKELNDIKSGNIRVSDKSGKVCVGVPIHQRVEEIDKFEALDIIVRKGVAVGFIQLLIDENAGGVNEYNSYIGIKELFLTNREYNLIRKLIIYEKNQRNNFRRSEENL